MSEQTRRYAGWLIIILPTVIYGGTSLLSLFIESGSENLFRREMWRAGHAHAGVLLILSLLCYLYVDKAKLSEGFKKLVRIAIPLSAIFLSAAFFLSVLPPDATEPNNIIYLAYLGAVSLALGLVILGIGLIRKSR